MFYSDDEREASSTGGFLEFDWEEQDPEATRVGFPEDVEVLLPPQNSLLSRSRCIGCKSEKVVGTMYFPHPDVPTPVCVLEHLQSLPLRGRKKKMRYCFCTYCYDLAWPDFYRFSAMQRAILEKGIEEDEARMNSY